MTVQSPPADTVRAALDRIFADPAYEWSDPGGLWTRLEEWFQRLRTWLASLETDHPIAFYLLLLAATVILVAILVHLGYLSWRAVRPRASRDEPASGTPMVVRDEAWHRAAFEQCLAEGRYAEAMAQRFAALVFQLQRMAALRLDRSKTPAEYAAEARLDPEGRTAMGALVEDLYATLFGGAPSTADDVTRFDALAGRVVTRVAPS